MGAKFEPAPEVERLARDIIRQCHTHLIEARLVYLFRDGEWESKGKLVLGKAIKLSGREKHLVGYDFAIVINKRAWQKLSETQRPALVDHELCHCGIDGEDKDGNPRWTIWPHDLEEFRQVINRHGLWMPDVKAFARSIAPHLQVTFDLNQVAATTELPATDSAAQTAPSPDAAEPGEAPTEAVNLCPMCEGVQGHECPICGGSGILEPNKPGPIGDI